MDKVFLFLVVSFVISIIWQKHYSQKKKSFACYKNNFFQNSPKSLVYKIQKSSRYWKLHTFIIVGHMYRTNLALIIIMLVETNGKKSLWKEFLLLNKLHCSILKVYV
jgi:hypothetical protein